MKMTNKQFHSTCEYQNAIGRMTIDTEELTEELEQCIKAVREPNKQVVISASNREVIRRLKSRMISVLLETVKINDALDDIHDQLEKTIYASEE